MEASTNVDGNTVSQSLARSQNRSSGSQPESLDQLGRVRDLKFHLFKRAERPGPKLVHIFRGVYEQDVLVGSRLGFQEVRGLGNAACEQTVVDEPVLLGREDVSPDGQVVAVAVDELEEEHGVRFHDTAACLLKFVVPNAPVMMSEVR